MKCKGVYSVGFLGDKIFTDELRLEILIRSFVCDLTELNEFVDFYFGCDGDFEIMAARIAEQFSIENDVQNYSVNFVSHYEMDYAEKCDLIICHLKHEQGLSAQVLEKARKLQKNIIHTTQGA